MKNLRLFFPLFFFINCSKTFETNLPFKFSFDYDFRSVYIYGGSNEDIAHSILFLLSTHLKMTQNLKLI